MKIKDYKRAIEIVTDGNTNFKDLCIKIAQQRPDILIAANDAAETWRQEAKFLRDSGQKVVGIKLIREKTGMGLKESKDLIESL